MKKVFLIYILLLLVVSYSFSQTITQTREHLLMDFGWRFAFGHPFDTKKDFNNGNGKETGANLKQDQRGNECQLPASQVHAGKNTIAIAATPLLKRQSWDNININPGLFQIVSPAAQWKRKLFNGLAQVIVQATGEEGDIILTATSDKLKPASIKIKSIKANVRPAVPDK